jgi:beta-N-acetylhexosaminidase
MTEMRRVAAHVPELVGRSAERAERALDVIRRGGEGGSVEILRAEFDSLLAMVA